MSDSISRAYRRGSIMDLPDFRNWRNTSKAQGFCDRLCRENHEEYKALVEVIKQRENLK